MGKNNTKWVAWKNRNTISLKDQPAIYFIAHISENLEKKEFKYIEEIVYIGMTISKKGLKGRLDQFEKAMRGSDRVHGGAERVRFRHADADLFFENTYVSACIFELSKTRDTPHDWRKKAECVGHEYNSFAMYLELFDKLPEFNDHAKSKKK